MITFFNQSEANTAVITGPQNIHVATVYPGKSVTLPDAYRDDPGIHWFLSRGVLVVVPEGQALPAYKPVVAKKPPQMALSHIKSAEVLLQTGPQQVVSIVKDGADFYKGPMEGAPEAPVAPTPAAEMEADPNVEVIGQQLVRKGSVSKPTTLMKLRPGVAPSSQPNIIRMESPGTEAALDQGAIQDPLLSGLPDGGIIQDSAQMIVESAIPGQATLIPVDDMIASRLDTLQGQMNQIWTEHVKQRKYWQIVGSYPHMPAEKKIPLIQNVKDPEILRGMAAGEKSGELLMMIANKYKQVTGQSLLVQQAAPVAQKPKPGQVKLKPGQNKPKPKPAKPAKQMVADRTV